MVISQQRQRRLKPFLDKGPPGFLVETSWLRAQSIDPKSIHNYVKHGWLEHVIRGVYRRPLPEGLSKDSGIPWETTPLSLQQIMGYHIHPGAESALEIRGYSHYLRFGRMPYIHLYGKALPWLTRLQGETKIIIHQNNLFGDNPVGLVPRANWRRNQMTNPWSWSLNTSSCGRAGTLWKRTVARKISNE